MKLRRWFICKGQPCIVFFRWAVLTSTERWDFMSHWNVTITRAEWPPKWLYSYLIRYAALKWLDWHFFPFLIKQSEKVVFFFWLFFFTDYEYWLQKKKNTKKKTTKHWPSSTLRLYACVCKRLALRTCRWLCLPINDAWPETLIDCWSVQIVNHLLTAERLTSVISEDIMHIMSYEKILDAIRLTIKIELIVIFSFYVYWTIKGL